MPKFTQYNRPTGYGPRITEHEDLIARLNNEIKDVGGEGTDMYFELDTSAAGRNNENNTRRVWVISNGEHVGQLWLGPGEESRFGTTINVGLQKSTSKNPFGVATAVVTPRITTDANDRNAKPVVALTENDIQVRTPLRTTALYLAQARKEQKRYDVPFRRALTDVMQRGSEERDLPAADSNTSTKLIVFALFIEAIPWRIFP
jgi:hypothetical protein